MADVISHRSDRSAPPPKRRDISRGINLEKVWQANGKMPLPIAFDNVEHTMLPIGNNAKYFTHLVENQVRFTVTPCYSSWTEVLEEKRARLCSIIEVASSGTSLDERAIANKVLGERRGHIRRVGRVPKGTSLSLDSIAASKAPQGTFHQFFGDPQNNDHRFAMYEAQLRRMQRKIELLKNSILVVVPEEDKNGDDDEGLWGL
ncbi:hypothetical protein Adt_12191 [Abeliophyllum distichum]|uniref:Uncharacterized protein n=1 Tax=Abeliophyllum distichum TaxID=126358 RepID=A0ABD1UQC1_9LAMI